MALFGNSKAQEQLEEQFKQTQRRVKTLGENVKNGQEATKRLTKDIRELHTQQQDLHKQLTDAVKSFKETADQVNTVIIDLKLLRPRLEKKMQEDFSSAVEQELANTTNKIEAQAAGFNHAKDVFSKYIATTQDVGNEMQKFLLIAKQLDEKDFALENYAKRLEQTDAEKLRLLKRIDELERLLAKMKRGKK